MTEVKEGQQHLYARKQVEWYLEIKERKVWKGTNVFKFKPEFVKKHRLEKRFQGHSYDILTDKEVIEIDDMDSHPKKSHRIADGIAEEYIKEYHPEYKFYRLLKEEIADRKGRILDPEDVANYLKENLF